MGEEYNNIFIRIHCTEPTTPGTLLYFVYNVRRRFTNLSDAVHMTVYRALYLPL